MIQQPDTATMDGRHAVERASLKFLTQRRSDESTEWEDYPDFTGMNFDWEDYDHRINPDDLAAWSETQVRDVWTFSNLSKLCVNGRCKGTFTPWQDDSVKTLLTALNGAPAADMAESERLTYNKEINGLKSQLSSYGVTVKAWTNESRKLKATIETLKRQCKETYVKSTMARSVMDEAVKRGWVEIRNLPQKDATGNTVGKCLKAVWLTGYTTEADTAKLCATLADMNRDRETRATVSRAWSEECTKLTRENADLKRQLADKDESIKHFLDEIEDLQTDKADLIRKRTWITNQLTDKDYYIADRDKMIGILNAKLDESDRVNAELEAEVTRLTNRLREMCNKEPAPVTAQDWDEKKEPATVIASYGDLKIERATVTPGPAEDYRPWTMEDVKAGTVLKWVKSAVTVLVTHVGPSDVNIMGRPVDYNGILCSGWRQLNGDRCGVRKEGV